MIIRSIGLEPSKINQRLKFLFYNSARRKVGLVGYWDVVAFDEFAGVGKRVDNTIESVSQESRFCKAFEITYLRID